MMITLKQSICFFASLLAVASVASADSLLVGFNTQTPLQVYSTTGAYQQDFGPTGASAGIEENGLLYVVQPSTSGASTSTITALNAAQQVASSFSVPDLISDGAPGQNGTLWLSGYDGTVYQVSTLGTVLSSFSTGYTNIGVASNGSTLYTTEGNTGDGIDLRNSSGAVLKTIHTGFTSLYGIGYDTSNSSLLAGTFDYIYDFSLAGSLLATLNVPGDSRTANGVVHDGLELGDLSLLQSPTPPTTVPEPSLGLMTGLLAGLFAFSRRIRRGFIRNLKLTPGLLLALNAFGSVAVTLTPSALTVPVGSNITFTAKASDSSNSGATFTYRFSVAPSGSASYSVIKDYYKYNSLTWADTTAEGVYDVQVIAKSSSGQSGSAVEPVTFSSRVTGTSPVVNKTQNPLVALYSAPPCSASQTMRVRFRTQSATSWQATPFKTCTGLSMNFLIAGMLPDTTYVLQQDLYKGPFDTPGPSLTFATGSLPGATAQFPTLSTLAGPTTPSSISFPYILEERGYYPFAHDLNGNIVWYLSAMNNPAESGYPVRNTNSGTLLTIMDDPNGPCSGGVCYNHEFLREFDLAGNLVRETNWTIVKQEVNVLRTAQGKQMANVIWFSHEGFRLPNGYTVAIMTDERVEGNVDVLGDIAVVLDQNFQAVWEWDTFDHLTSTRPGYEALLNDTCAAAPNGGPGCPLLTNKMPNGQIYAVANDWTHMNSATLDPSDGNLILSIRAQAWVVKVTYQNGTGNGQPIWTLGMDGSFALPSGTLQSAWFTYQHDVEIWPNGLLTLFDNGNYRVAKNLGGGNDSRGQAWTLDTTNMIATPAANFDLGVYSPAVGYASVLSNGNYDFSAGFINSGTETQTFEFSPGGVTPVFKDELSGSRYSSSYRSIRLPDLYTQR